MAPLRLGLFKHLGHGGAREDVVKLLEQQRAPLLLPAGLLAAEGLRQIGLQQQPLQSAVVALLVRAAGGAPAMQLQIELVAPQRQLPLVRFEFVQIAAHGSKFSWCAEGLLLPQLQLLQHFLAGSAAVITHTRQP